MKMKLRIIALAVVLSLIFISCSAAADEKQEQINLRKSDEERKAEFNQALSGISYHVSDFDKLSFQDGLKRSKNNFTRLYRSQWKSHGMAQKLEHAVNTAFDENTQDLMWGTTGFQITINKGQIIEKIQETAAFKFTADFNDFISTLEEKWGETLQIDVADFYQRTAVPILASNKNPMVRAYIRENSAVENKGIDVMSRVKDSIQRQYPDLKLSGASLTGGVLTVLLRRQIQKMIVRQLGKTALRKVTSTAVSKAAGYVIPVAGWVMVAWSALDFASTAWNAPDEVRSLLQEQNRAMYEREIPEIYWDAMEPYVRDVFIEEYGELQRMRKHAVGLLDNHVIISLTKGLKDDEAVEFSRRIVALAKALDHEDYNDLLTDFGEIIRDSSRREFETLALMLQHEKTIQVKEWLQIAGRKYFELYNTFPRDIWVDFPPNQESFETLSWMMKLPPKARRTALKLLISDINFLIKGLPERFIPQLFSSTTEGGNDPDAIHAEINRLAQLPDIESRRPWQGALAYYITLYSFYVKIFVFIILALIALRIVMGIIRMGKRKKERAAAQSEHSVINVNIPAYQQQPMPVTKNKIKVRAKISMNVANELKTITWDISQQILPDDDDNDSDKRILIVELENLDKFASWLAKYKNEIEVLQPEELKIKL